MGLLADTIRDARRPVPAAGTWLRRAAIDEPAPEPEDSGDPGAMTVFRLQKEGGTQPSVAPARQPQSAVRDGPSAGSRGGFCANGDGPANPSFRVEPRKESKQRESRFVVNEAFVSKASRRPPSLGSADTSPLPTMRHASEIAVDSQSEVSRPTEGMYVARRVARGAPSEGPDTASPPGMGVALDEAAARGPLSHAPTVAPPPAEGRGTARALPGPDDHAEPSPTRATLLDPASVPPAAVAVEPGPVAREPPSAPRAVERAAPARPAVPPPRASHESPSLRIGRIDVTVLADPAARPAPKAEATDPHFLSRHYLRRA